jgi:hypothetical protein
VNGSDYDPAVAGVQTISRQELHVKMRESTVIVVDAQAPGWYEREHLPGALRADVGNIDDLVTKLGNHPHSRSSCTATATCARPRLTFRRISCVGVTPMFGGTLKANEAGSKLGCRLSQAAR